MRGLVVALLLYSIPVLAVDWGREYWQYLTWNQVEEGKHRLYFRGEARFFDEKFYYYRLSENYAYQVLPRLGLEAHYSFIHEKSIGGLNFTNRHRFEFEINPSVALCDQVDLRFRNRLELIKHENIARWNVVLRQRTMAVFPIDDCGPLVAWRISDELFYSFESLLFTQNRFIPIELAFQASNALEIDLFFMVRNFISSSKWRRSFVLGTNFEF
jgi:hypothetical protein